MKKLTLILNSLCSLLSFAGNTVRECMVTTKDGTKLHTVVSIPKNGIRFPVIITRSPYLPKDAKGLEKQRERLKKEAQYGYVVILQSCRGTGPSEGDFIPYVNEKSDGLDLLDWVRKQDFYNGEIFLSGTSYGVSTFASWLNECPPDVKGAFWGAQDTERYNLVYRNGFLRMELHAAYHLQMYKKNSGIVRKMDEAHLDSFPLAGFTERVLGERAVDMEELLLHPDRNDPFWKTSGFGGGEYSRAAVNSKLPIFFGGSWHDLYTGGMFDIWRSLDPAHRQNCVFAITPFEHGFLFRKKTLVKELHSPGGALMEYAPGKPLQYQWFDHIRSGEKLKYFQKGKITRFVLLGKKWEVSSEVGTNSFPVKFYLSQDRKLVESSVAQGSVSYDYDPRNPAIFQGGCEGVFGGVKYQDAPNSRPDIISFVTDKFKKDTVLEGECKVRLHVSSTAPDTCFYVRLSVVKKNGTLGLRNEIDSICRTNPEFTPNGEAVIDFTLVPHHFKIGKGEQLRLDVSSSCWPYYQLHSNFRGNQALQTETQVARNKILFGKSYIVFPFVKEK